MMTGVFILEVLGIAGSVLFVGVNVLSTSGSPLVCQTLPNATTLWFPETIVPNPLAHFLIFGTGPLVLFPVLPHLFCRCDKTLRTNVAVGGVASGVVFRVVSVCVARCLIGLGGLAAAVAGVGIECVCYLSALCMLIRPGQNSSVAVEHIEENPFLGGTRRRAPGACCCGTGCPRSCIG